MRGSPHPLQTCTDAPTALRQSSAPFGLPLRVVPEVSEDACWLLCSTCMSSRGSVFTTPIPLFSAEDLLDGA